jgi:hypothetical protein
MSPFFHACFGLFILALLVLACAGAVVSLSHATAAANARCASIGGMAIVADGEWHCVAELKR